ncbi:hypothetical protein D3C78_1856230 [compost metagenome]
MAKCEFKALTKRQRFLKLFISPGAVNNIVLLVTMVEIPGAIFIILITFFDIIHGSF